jgi:hypothetical protein
VIFYTVFFLRSTKRDFTENAAQCPELDNVEDTFSSEHELINEDEEITNSNSGLSNVGQHNCQGTIFEDDDSIGSSSSVDICRQGNCQNYTCCENEACGEEAVILNQCPNEVKCQRAEISFVEETEYKIKDLTNYLGMMDGVSSSIVDQKVDNSYFFLI